MLASEKVRQVAEAEVGVREVGGANDGPRVREYQASVKVHPPLGSPDYPWCAAFCTWVYREAGLDGSWITCSTGLACTNAAKMGFVSDTPRTGALLSWCGTHIGILIEPVGGGLWRTIEGNSGDAVSWRTRSLAGAKILVSPELAGEAVEVDARRRYWIQDPSKKGKGEWTGPWLSKEARDKLQKSLEERLGHKLRACSFFGAFDPKTGTIVAKPDPMGPTRGGDDPLDGPPDVGGVDDPPTEPTDVPMSQAGG